MPRFALREFANPNYADALPAFDPNNALWPRISAAAKMLNEMPWFKKDEDELNDEQKYEKAVRRQAEEDKNLEQEVQRMDDPEGLTTYERSIREGGIEDPSRPDIVPKMKGYVPDVEDDGQLHVEDIENGTDPIGFNPATATKKEIKAMQKQLREGGYDVSVDGTWGDQSAAAYEDYRKKLLGNLLYNQNIGSIVSQPPEELEFAIALDEANKRNGIESPQRSRSLGKIEDEAVKAAGDAEYFDKGPTEDDDEFVRYFHAGVPTYPYEESLRRKYNMGR